MLRAEDWLDLELGRIWLLGEICLRHLQQAKLRGPASADVEAILAARAESRDGGSDLPALAVRLERVEREVRTARKDAPIAQLAVRLGLSALEVETLVFAVAPHIDPPLAELFHALRGQRRGVGLALVTQLLRLDRDARTALLSTLDADRPLLAWRLVEAAPADPNDGSVANRVLQPTFGAIELLRGRGPSAIVSRHAEVVTAQPTLADLVLAPAQRTAIERLCRPGGASQPWTVLWGGKGVGKREIAARMAAHDGKPLLALDIASADRASRGELVRLAMRDALVLGAALYIGPLAPSGDETAEVLRHLRSPMRRNPAPIVLGIETTRAPRLQIEHAVRELELKMPDERGRIALWQRAAPDDRGDLELDALARSFELAPGEILETADEARAVAAAEQRPLAHADLRAGVDRRLRNALADLAWRIDVSARWDDIVLTREDRDRVDEFVARRLFAHQVYGAWGLGDRIERGRGSIGLFSGPPGTGKTMLAGLIAKGLGLELYQVDLAQIQSRWVGETEKALGKLFDLAERAHAVLLFDEADSLLSKRTDVESSNDRYANANVNYLLQRLEQYRGVAILTTNKDAALDEALQRRLTLHLRLAVPELTERVRLWQSFLPAALPRSAELDIAALAHEFELTGGYIKNVVVRAAFLAARERGVIGTALLRRAAVLELEDMGRVIRAA